MDPRAAGRVARQLEALHALCYFVPEVEAELTGLGLRKGRMAYFAGRAAPMGRVGSGPVTATFFVFNPGLVAHFVPACWALAEPEAVTRARYRGVSAAYTRLLGAGALTSPELAEAADLARQAAEACRPEGRALYAAHADLAWPDATHLVLFHALTLLREHRGDGHVATLLQEDLTGLESLVTHTATGRGFTQPAAQATRGWSDEEWAAATASLAERGLLTADGALTEEGKAVRTRIERTTETLARAPWDALGEAGTARLSELTLPLVARTLAGGAFPDGVFA